MEVRCRAGDLAGHDPLPEYEYAVSVGMPKGDHDGTSDSYDHRSQEAKIATLMKMAVG